MEKLLFATQNKPSTIIFTYSPDFVVEHSAVYTLDNVTEAEEIALAEVLKEARNNPLQIGQANATIVKEPTVRRNTSNVFGKTDI